MSVLFQIILQQGDSQVRYHCQIETVEALTLNVQQGCASITLCMLQTLWNARER